MRVDMRGQCLIIATYKPCVDQPWIYQIMSCIDAVFWMLQSQAFGQDITQKTSRIFVRHHLFSNGLMSILMFTWCHALDSFSQAFLSIFAYYKRSKTGGGNALGMMLPQLQCPRRANYQLTFGLESHQSCCLLENSSLTSVSKARKFCIYTDDSWWPLTPGSRADSLQHAIIRNILSCLRVKHN